MRSEAVCSKPMGCLTRTSRNHKEHAACVYRRCTGLRWRIHYHPCEGCKYLLVVQVKTLNTRFHQRIIEKDKQIKELQHKLDEQTSEMAWLNNLKLLRYGPSRAL